MNKNEFDKYIQNEKVKRPKLFGLEADTIPSLDDIKDVEKNMGIKFPQSYIDFILTYGGGYFAFVAVYSFDKKSEFYIKQHTVFEFMKMYNFFPVIDFETGDVAGFKIIDGICEDDMYIFNHEDKNLINLNIGFFETLLKYGIKIL